MNVIRWGVGLAVTITAAAAVVGAPEASAVPLPAPATSRGNAVGMTEHGSALVTFDTSDPGGLQLIGSVRGLKGDRLIGIDFRPRTDVLHAVDVKGRIFTIDTGTALATQVGTLSIKIDGGNWDIEFTTTGDTLRIITDKGQNLRQRFGAVGPTGATVEDPTLSRRNVHALGYTDAGKGLGIDSSKRQIVTVDGRTGKVKGFGPANGLPPLKSTGSSTGIDVVGNSAFATVNANSYHTLYKVNITTGDVQKVGVFNPGGEPDPYNRHVTDIALRR